MAAVNVGGLPTSCSSTPQASVGGAARRQFFQHHPRVNPNVAFGMKLRRLLDALHSRDVRQHRGEQSGFIQQLEAAPRGAFGQQLGQFVANALGGNLAHCAVRVCASPPALRIRSESRIARQTARRASCAIYLPRSGAADRRSRAQFPRVKSSRPPTKSRTSPVCGIHQQTIDGEIAAAHVFLRGPGINDVVRVAAIGVADVGTERCHFDVLGFSHVLRRIDHKDHAEFCADAEAAQEIIAVRDRAWRRWRRRNRRVCGPARDRAHSRRRDRPGDRSR